MKLKKLTQIYNWSIFLQINCLYLIVKCSPLDCKETNQSILKEISPGCPLEGLMLKLKLQCLGHLMQRTDSYEKTLIQGKIECGMRNGRQRIRRLDDITNSMDIS